MPLKTVKKDTAEALTLEWILHVKNFKLALDKKLCAGCQICSLGCPKEAIKAEKQPKVGGEKAKKAKVDIDLAKCTFCGICDVLCPYGAITVTLDGKHILSIVEKESFPQLIRDIQVNASKCAARCVECEKACPLGLIKVSWLNHNEENVEPMNSEIDEKKSGLAAKVEVQKEHCPCCRICEIKCPQGLIHVRKILQGKIVINRKMCPEGCKDCMDVCPLTGALYLSNEDKKVCVNEIFCVYCGACKIVCPIEQALELKRTRIAHTAVRSGAWNKALERLASPVEISKELRTRGSLKARESVKMRIGLKGEQDA